MKGLEGGSDSLPPQREATKGKKVEQKRFDVTKVSIKADNDKSQKSSESNNIRDQKSEQGLLNEVTEAQTSDPVVDRRRMVTFAPVEREIKEFKNIDHKLVKAKHTDSVELKGVKIPLRTRVVDFGRWVLRMKEREHRPERVYKEIEQFNTTMRKIDTKIERLYPHPQYEEAIQFLPKKVEDEFIEKTFSLTNDFQRFAEQAVSDYGDGVKGKAARGQGEAKIRDINGQLQKMHEDLDSWEHIHEQRSQFDSTMQYIQETGKRNLSEELQNKCEEKLNSLGMYYKDSCAALENHYICNHSINKDHEGRINNLNQEISRMNKCLEKFPQIQEMHKQFNITLENIQEKIREGYLPGEFRHTLKERLNSLSEGFKASFASIARDYSKAFSFKEQHEASITDLHSQIKEMNEDLDRWYHIQKVQGELEKALDYVPQAYRSLVRNLSDAEVALATASYKQVLEGNQQGNEQPLTKEHFKQACHLLKERPDMLKETCYEQIDRINTNIKCQYQVLQSSTEDLLQKIKSPARKSSLEKFRDHYQEKWKQYRKEWKQYKGEWKEQSRDSTLKPDQWRQKFDAYLKDSYQKEKEFQNILSEEGWRYPHGEDDDLMNTWKEHARSHEMLLSCLGERNTFTSNEDLAKNMNLYMNYMEKCIQNVFQGREERNPHEVGKWVDAFISMKKNFETYLKEYGWLKDTRVEAFQRVFETTVTENPGNKGIFMILSNDKFGVGYHENRINVDEGKIIGISNFKSYAKNWSLSEVVYTQLQLALKKAGKDLSQFDLKSWYGMNVVNQETKSLAEHLLPEGETERTFKAGSEEFAAFARTATAKSKFYLLAQHPEAFGGKEVTSITVKRVLERDGHKLDGEEIDIDYAIGEKLAKVHEIAESKDKQYGEPSITRKEIKEKHISITNNNMLEEDNDGEANDEKQSLRMIIEGNNHNLQHDKIDIQERMKYSDIMLNNSKKLFELLEKDLPLLKQQKKYKELQASLNEMEEVYKIIETEARGIKTGWKHYESRLKYDKKRLENRQNVCEEITITWVINNMDKKKRQKLQNTLKKQVYDKLKQGKKNEYTIEEETERAKLKKEMKLLKNTQDLQKREGKKLCELLGSEGIRKQWEQMQQDIRGHEIRKLRKLLQGDLNPEKQTWKQLRAMSQKGKQMGLLNEYLQSEKKSIKEGIDNIQKELDKDLINKIDKDLALKKATIQAYKNRLSS